MVSRLRLFGSGTRLAILGETRPGVTNSADADAKPTQVDAAMNGTDVTLALAELEVTLTAVRVLTP